MAGNIMKAGLAAVAALVLGGAAQAAQIDIAISTPDGGAAQPVQYGGDDYGHRRYIRSPWEHGQGYRHPDRYYGRPVPERGYWDRHSWARPVYGRPYWSDQDDCRIIVKKRVSPWGETVKRIKICD